jgi:hypothetical protein
VLLIFTEGIFSHSPRAWAQNSNLGPKGKHPQGGSRCSLTEWQEQNQEVEGNFLFFSILGFELRASKLLGRCYHLSHTPTPFLLLAWYSDIRCHFCPAWLLTITR